MSFEYKTPTLDLVLPLLVLPLLLEVKINLVLLLESFSPLVIKTHLGFSFDKDTEPQHRGKV